VVRVVRVEYHNQAREFFITNISIQLMILFSSLGFHNFSHKPIHLAQVANAANIFTVVNYGCKYLLTYVAVARAYKLQFSIVVLHASVFFTVVSYAR